MGDSVLEYISNIEVLDFQIENKNRSSVFLVHKLEEYIEQKDISPYIIFALDKARIFNVDAVYFRFFDDDRPPLAQIYIYDNISQPKPNDYYAEKHRAIWSSCEIPIFLIVEKSVVKIYDSREPVVIDNGNIKSLSIKTIDLSLISQALKEYNAELFDNGSFWETIGNKNHFLYNKVASERLIAGLRKVRECLHAEKYLSSELVDKLLIICILIKYLEENGIDKESGQNLAHLFFKSATGYETLGKIIYNNKLVCLLEALAKHFNGGIFSLEEVWLNRLVNTDISSLATFFEAGYQNNLFGWYEYSFEHIPVELISNFYEEFIPKKDNPTNEEQSRKSTGAVYTPSFLVNLLIDECIPLSYSDLSADLKLIDPTCGSGIFLVTAYKRLVQRWRLKNSKRGNLANATPVVLKNILSKNIFGIDENQNSVNLSIFSLQLALCSMLTPRQIWVEFGHLDNLEGKNIIKKDFFEYLISSNKNQDFDLVIGNPPFTRKKLGGKTYKYYEDLLKERYPIKFKNEEEEFALLFLEKTAHLLKKGKGKLCLILPSGPLLYLDKSSVQYRKSLFNEYKVSQIIDFTYLRRILFSATIPTLAIFLESASPAKESSILHVVAKRTKASKEKAYFEFDHYDFYNVPLEYVTATPNIWKCNLVGGNLPYTLVKKLEGFTLKVKDFYEKEKIVPKNSVSKNEYSELSINEKTKINDQYSLFTEVSFSDDQKSKLSDIGIWALRKKITKGHFPEEVVASDFKKKTTFDGISYKGHKESLRKLKDYFVKNCSSICFYIASTSSRQGIRSPYVIYLSDIDNFPYVEELNKVLTTKDKIIIEDIAGYSLDEFGNGEKALINKNIASIKDIKNFSVVYCDVLNSIYETNKARYILSSIIDGKAYYICEYSFTDEKIKLPNIMESQDNLDELLESWNYGKSKKINRILRVYMPNKIRIIKPKQLRYWLKSKALRDADETFEDIMS